MSTLTVFKCPTCVHRFWRLGFQDVPQQQPLPHVCIYPLESSSKQTPAWWEPRTHQPRRLAAAAGYRAQFNPAFHPVAFLLMTISGRKRINKSQEYSQSIFTKVTTPKSLHQFQIFSFANLNFRKGNKKGPYHSHFHRILWEEIEETNKVRILTFCQLFVGSPRISQLQEPQSQWCAASKVCPFMVANCKRGKTFASSLLGSLASLIITLMHGRLIGEKQILYIQDPHKIYMTYRQPGN